MFDIGFSELLLIAVVALIVIGPQRLPRVARTLGHLLGRAQRYVNDVKADISREMELEELKKVQSSMEEAALAMRDSVNQGISETEGELNRLAETAGSEADSSQAADGRQLDLALPERPEPGREPAPKSPA